MLANRSSIRESTREFPSYMMSGRELLLPVDSTFGRTQDRQIKADFIQDLMKNWNVHDLVAVKRDIMTLRHYV